MAIFISTNLSLSELLDMKGRYSAADLLTHFNPYSPAIRNLTAGASSTSVPTGEVIAAIKKKFKACVDILPVTINAYDGCVSVIAVRPRGSRISTALVSYNDRTGLYEVCSPRVRRRRELWKDASWEEQERNLCTKLGGRGVSGSLELHTHAINGAARAAGFVHKLTPYPQRELIHAVIYESSGTMRKVCHMVQDKKAGLVNMFDPRMVVEEMLSALREQRQSGQALALPPTGHVMSKFDEYWATFTELAYREQAEGERVPVYVLKMYGEDGVTCVYKLNSSTLSDEYGIINYPSATDMPLTLQGAVMALQIQEAERYSDIVEGVGIKHRDAACFGCEAVCAVTVGKDVIDEVRLSVVDRISI